MSPQDVCPCKDCTKRTSTCHSNCKDYKDWKDLLDERNRLIRKEKEKNWMFIDKRKHRPK